MSDTNWIHHLTTAHFFEEHKELTGNLLRMMRMLWQLSVAEAAHDTYVTPETLLRLERGDFTTGNDTDAIFELLELYRLDDKAAWRIIEGMADHGVTAAHYA